MKMYLIVIKILKQKLCVKTKFQRAIQAKILLCLYVFGFSLWAWLSDGSSEQTRDPYVT